MDYAIEIRFQKLVTEIEKHFGGGMDTQSILFLVGVQELGHGYKKFSKDEKVNLMHIALCKIFEPYGYYEYEGLDEDGWPHYKPQKKLPHLSDRQQQHLIKEALIEYFSDIYPIDSN
tara:strand:+ start:75 stop:425 length:351 start_codon:yes stop_codon:yes gene_type:complete